MRRPWLSLVLLCAGAVQASDDGAHALQVKVQPARPGTHCVADPAFMRRNHMDLLRHQRDLTVHDGVRGQRFSLKGCVDCHASAATHSVAAAPGDFCVACHRYAAVTIDCFECHSSQPRAVALETPK